MNVVHHLEHAGDFQQLQALNGYFYRPRIQKLTLSSSYLNEKEATETSQQIKRLFNDCACQWGSLTMLAVFIPLLISVWGKDPLNYWELLAYFLLSVVAGFAAKMLGLWVNHFRIKRKLQELQSMTELFVQPANTQLS